MSHEQSLLHLQQHKHVNLRQSECMQWETWLLRHAPHITRSKQQHEQQHAAQRHSEALHQGDLALQSHSTHSTALALWLHHAPFTQHSQHSSYMRVRTFIQASITLHTIHAQWLPLGSRTRHPRPAELEHSLMAPSSKLGL